MDSIFQEIRIPLERLADVDRILLEKQASRSNGSHESASEWRDKLALLWDVPVLVNRAYRRIWDELTAGKRPDAQLAGELVFAWWDKILHTLRSLRQSAWILERCGGPLSDIGRMDSMIAQLERERDLARRGWPWSTLEEENQVAQEYARGESQSVEEILRELQGAHR